MEDLERLDGWKKRIRQSLPKLAGEFPNSPETIEDQIVFLLGKHEGLCMAYNVKPDEEFVQFLQSCLPKDS